MADVTPGPDTGEPPASVAGDAAGSQVGPARDRSAGDGVAQEAGGATDAGPEFADKRVEATSGDTTDSDAAAGTVGTGDGEPRPGGKRKRRRKPKREAPHGPLLRFLAQGARRHAFSVDEEVAGRVVRTEAGVIVIDLFGKATAFADEHEPREAPARPEPRAVPAPGAQGDASGTADAALVGAGAASEPVASSAGSGPRDVAPAAPVPESAMLAAATDAADVQDARDEDAEADDDHAADGERGDDGAGYGESHDEADHAHDAHGAHDAHDAHDGDADGADDAGGADDDDDGADDVDDAGDATAANGAPGVPGIAARRGPLAPLPVVPDALPRLEAAQPGHVFRGRVGAVAESGHLVIVNRLVDEKEARAELERCRESRRRVQGLVYGFNRGGFDVLVAGVRAFSPARTMSLGEIADPAAYLGQRLEFLIPAFQPLGRDIIVSRRSILEREQRKRAREFVRTLTPGQRLQGRVTQVFEFGVLVDIGGAEGLVHQSELSWARGVRPADVAKPGDEIEVQVLRVGEPGGKPGAGRRDRVVRVALSIRALQPDPWAAHAATLTEGTVRKGKVVRLTEFGAFVELASAIDGLLHVSELGREVKHVGDVLKEGEEIQVVIEHVDHRARRIALSRPTPGEIQDQEAGRLGGPDAPKEVRPGSRVKVRVEKSEHRGLLVRVAGLAGRRARGYLAKSDLGGEREGDHRRAYPVGSELEAKVVGFDRDGELKFSVKALQIDEERRAVKDYRREAATKGFGTFGDLLRAKLGETGK